MRHKRVAKKLGRTKAHREQLVGGLVAHLIVQGRIETTLPKARQTRAAEDGHAGTKTLASRRLAATRLQPGAVQRLFDDVVPAMEGRRWLYAYHQDAYPPATPCDGAHQWVGTASEAPEGAAKA